MATRLKLKEEFLTCIICHEVFRDPVTLHCGHTFCAQCVTAYTKTQKQAIGEKSIPCPHCRAFTKVPDPTKPTDEWAGQFKTGFFVRGLVDAVFTDGKDDDSCTPCQEDGVTIPAVFWCSDCEHGFCSGCENVHRKMPLTKKHEVINLSADSRQSVKKSRKRFMCSKHPDAVIDMMCEDCDVAVCHRCCILHHRKCESVITLVESLPKLKSVIEAHGKELATVVVEVNEKLALKNLQLNDVEKKAKEVVAAIDISGDKIIAEVRAQQQQLKEKMEQAKDKALQNLKADIKSGEMQLEEAKQRQGLMREAIECDVVMNYYEMYKICKPSAIKQVADAKTNTENKDFIYMELEDNSDAIVSVIRERSIASLNRRGDNTLPVGSGSKPRLVRKIDTGLADIWDVLVLTVNGIKTVIVSSWSKNGVSSFYQDSHGKQCQNHLDISLRGAFNLTHISGGKCAVAVRNDKKIEVFSVTPDLIHEKTITTSKGYLGLACLNSSTFAAGGENPGVIDIIDMSGNILRSFGSNLFHAVVYLSCTNNNVILASDYSKQSLAGITDQGVIEFQYPQTADKKLQHPWGVCLSKCGEIFVTDESANNVVQLTDKGKFVRVVLSSDDGLSKPRALFVDDDNLMYVSVNHTTIHVYEFK